MNVKIEESWRTHLQEEFDKPYFEKLVTFIRSEYGRTQVLPPGHQIFHVFNSCPFEKVKVVILGQDPYPNPGQYYGICFSVPDGVAIPGSLINIFRNTTGFGKTNTHFRKFESLGRTRSISNEFCPHRTGLCNRFTSEYGLGNIYRCSH